MSTNATIILDKILEQKDQQLAPELSPQQFFEIFAAQEIVKDYDLSYEEIESGIVGGADDGGVDAIYAFVNGELLQDDLETPRPKRNATLELVLIQAKLSPSFTEAVVDKLKIFTEDLLDLSKDVDSQSTIYNPYVRAIIKRFRDAYEELASTYPDLSVSYYYACKGDQPHPKVKHKAEQVKETVQQLFSSAKVKFQFLGAAKLIELARRAPRSTFSLRLAESAISSSDDVSFVCLVRLEDYYSFITDKEGNLIRSIFESNVRDYQGTTEVNGQIQQTLEENPNDEFWWLNNGITVVAAQAALSGKTLTMDDPQIVNGLQTSTEIWKYFRNNNRQNEKRNLLVRVIVPPGPETRDRIIRATNSQTQIPIASLRATEVIHHDIEEYLRSYGWFYERRKNHYKNQDKPKEKIVSIPHLAQAVMAIVLQRPNDARARPSSLLKRDDDYEQVFNPKYPIPLYLNCAAIMKRVDEVVRSEEFGLDRKDQTNLRFYVAMDVAATAVGKPTPTPQEIANLTPSSLADDEIRSTQARVLKLYKDLGATDQVAKGIDLLRQVKAELQTRLRGADTTA